MTNIYGGLKSTINIEKMLLAISTAKVEADIPMIPFKKKWRIQIEGCYDLLFKYILVDFPTRTEVEKYVTDTFHTHDTTNKHFGKKSRKGHTNVGLIPKLQKLKKLGREFNMTKFLIFLDLVLGSKVIDYIEVKPGRVGDKIGAGV
jgi:hypothetical protein